ncbi:MAG: cbb3-type cytochrome c oxidase subunit II [Proteobacteria bacterium]|nr:cbb3-type cytochrome c oxidase subunit II [Pseudomonadota bacterium]
MNFHTNHRLLLAFAGIGYLVLTVLIAVGPAISVQGLSPLPGARERTALEERGRQLYLAEGCGFCHTQFVRDLPMDKPYGRQSVAEDYAAEDPPLLGTQRTGPDLANVGTRQPSETWHLIHLYNPRAVVPQSVMPGYPWYFAVRERVEPGETEVPLPESFRPSPGAVVVPTEDARALVAYLLSLRQVPVGL